MPYPNETSGLLEAPITPKTTGNTIKANALTALFDQPVPYSRIREELDSFNTEEEQEEESECPKLNSRPINLKSTIIGSLVFLLYHIVFCLAQAATITRPHANHSSTGIMAKTAALGIFTAGPIFLIELSGQIPAIYPASDLFLAPFLAQLSETIDQVLWENGMENHDTVFLATFGAVTGVGLLLSGSLCILAARVKVANLGAFLPYSVLCGFFTTIGILMWTLGFSVDVGMKVGQVITSRDPTIISNALLHHSPSFFVGLIMHLVGVRHPSLVISLVGLTIVGSYVILWLTGTTLERAQALGWFFSSEDLLPQESEGLDTFYSPPMPFGVLVSAFRGEVFVPAFQACIPTMLALAFLYLVRCSLHSAALKKNIPSVTRKQPEPPSPVRVPGRKVHHRYSSGGSFHDDDDDDDDNKNHKQPLTLGFILEHGYGYSQIVAALFGGITVAPSIAASLTLFKLGAEAAAPQYGSCLLVVVFYATNFTMVQYIPKPAFSCLMVLAGLDMCRTWILGSFLKTKAKAEWMVGPILVVLSFSIGMLNAIFWGIACSTFIFVANFYRTGAVKFVGNGLTLRSTVERGVTEAHWLDQNADLIQILVVQNYLFFGNAQSVLMYIMTMFEDEPAKNLDAQLPPKPKYLVVDFTTLPGMDVSAVDTMREILQLCKDNRCKLYIAGLSHDLKAMLLYAGVKPEPGAKRWSYVFDLESALAKAEDGLISDVFHLEEKDEAETGERRRVRSQSLVDDGFIYALQKIDEQHGTNTVVELASFAECTRAINLEPGGVLIREGVTAGLYFVETGLMRVQRSAGTTTVGMNNLSLADPNASIGHLNARSGMVGRQMAIWKAEREGQEHNEQTFRLARIGQGWIIGDIEVANGMKKPGIHVAISECRLHQLPFSAITEAEQSNPMLAMHLYKFLSHLSTKRQEMTIEQLGQHLRILNSPVPRLQSGGRSALARIQNPLYHQ